MGITKEDIIKAFNEEKRISFSCSSPITKEDFETLKETILSEKCPANFTINLQNAIFDQSDLAILFSILQSENCPPGLTFDLAHIVLEDESIKLLFETLAFSKHVTNLKLELQCMHKNISKNNIIILANVLKSGSGPDGLDISISTEEENILLLAEALMSGNCPPNFKLRLDEINKNGIEALAKALKSGACPPGLFFGLSGSAIDDESVQILANALAFGNSPKNLRIDLTANLFRAAGIQAIAAAIKSGRCPDGLGLALDQLTIEDAKTLADALESYLAPNGLQIRTSSFLDPKAKLILQQAVKNYHSQKRELLFTLFKILKQHDIALPPEMIEAILKASNSYFIPNISADAAAAAPDESRPLKKTSP